MGTLVRPLAYIAVCGSLSLIHIASVSSASTSTTVVSSNASTQDQTTITTTTQVSSQPESTSTTQLTPPKQSTTTTTTTTLSSSTTTITTQASLSTSSEKSSDKQPSSSTALSSSTSAAPSTTSATETPSTTTETPLLGGNCTDKEADWCNSTISGAVQCLDGTCQCETGHFKLNQSTCIPENDLKPTINEIFNISTTSLVVSWSHKDSVKDLALEYNVTASINDSDAEQSTVNCHQVDEHENRYICSQLTPGYMYEVEVTVIFNATYSRSGSKLESTYPSKPGPLERGKSNFTFPDVTLVWKNSVGRVEYYLVRVFKNESNETLYNATINFTTIHVPALEPIKDYYIRIIANSHGKPSDITEDTFFTLYSAPEPVTNVTVAVLNGTAVQVSWEVSTENPPSSVYEVTTNNVVDSTASNQSCLVEGGNITKCIVSGLDEYWIYSFNVLVSALNTTSSQTVSENVTTLDAAPGRITSANVVLFDTVSYCDATKVKVNWEEPSRRDRNSRIDKYFLEIGAIPPMEYTVPNPDPYRTDNRGFDKNITMLSAQTEYNLLIYASSNKYNDGKQYEITFSTDVCAPPAWTSSELDTVIMQRSTSSSVTIQFPNSLFSKTQQGSIDEKGFVVLVIGSDYYHDTQNIRLESVENWNNAKLNGFTEDFKVNIEGDIKGDMFEFGTEHCTVQSAFCNGPLPEQFTFKVAAYACTTKKKDNSKLCTVMARPLGPYSTKVKPRDNGSSSSGLVIGLSVVMVLLAACAAFTFLWYKDYIHPASWFSRKEADNDDEEFTILCKISESRPIKVCDFVSVLEEMHKDTNLILSDQYDDITKLGQMIADRSTTDAARHENNTPKNRWVNILPFDHSRVKLQQLDEDDPTTDYINANYIPGFHNKREYIATQGPLDGTKDDFWRMVWEQGVMVIVMVTRCKEGNRVKCAEYWPDVLREPQQYGEVVVNPISISQLDKYNITIFDVSVNDETRQVIHFHYLDFPDFSANVEFDHFINFVRTVRSHVPHNMKGPMVVHCSAGVGRTGTFIATDRLNLYLCSDKFSEEDEVDIFGIVVSMRENRVAMVQTESQYIMIHDCFEKMLEEKRAALKMTNSQEHLYENQAFDPYPETLYENVSTNERTEL